MSGKAQEEKKENENQANGAEKSETPKLSELEIEKKKSAELYDQLLRAKAEFENFRKRVDREKVEMLVYGKTQTYLGLLPLYDVLLHAHETIQKEDRKDSLVDGLEKIFAEFTKIFEKESIRGMDALNKPFDPNLHEVIGTVVDDALEEDTVCEVLQRGFLLGEKVLRHARVRISKKSK